MSEKALPILFLNLAGEMLYVLDQRLYAQKIPGEKGKKILEDIVTNVFSERFLDEIFKPQDMCSKKALKTIFERLAHTSIMRLNQNSMDKLFDLMTMAVKYQISLVTKPREILLVTLNHMDSIQPFVAHSNICLQLIENCYKRIFRTYLHLNDYEMQFIRHTILNFFLDMRIKVSVFLREKVQNWDGSFVLFYDGPVAKGAGVPGTITYYDSTSEKSGFKENKFNPSARYSPALNEGSYERYGDRVTLLGLNVYSSSKMADSIVASEMNDSQNSGVSSSVKVISDYDSMVPDPKAKAQLDLLCRLIGKSSRTNDEFTGVDFKLNLFNNEEEEFIYKTQVNLDHQTIDSKSNSKTVNFDASKRHLDERLNKVIDQFSQNRYERDEEFDNQETRRYGRRKTEKAGKPDGYKSTRASNDFAVDDENDDDDDIVALMDRMNRK